MMCFYLFLVVQPEGFCSWGKNRFNRTSTIHETQRCLTFHHVFFLFFFFFSFYPPQVNSSSAASAASATAAASDGRGTAPPCLRETHRPADEACWLTARQCQVTRPGMGPRTGSPSSSAWPEGRRAGRWASSSPRCM